MIDKIIANIELIWNEEMNKPILVAVDGRCAAGKTTLAAKLQETLGCTVIHMDDFFLRPEQRTKERLEQPGGNIDWERCREEVLAPFKQGIPFLYRPYDCHIKDFKEPVRVTPNRLALVEGSYSCHPELWSLYDLHIFLTISEENQRRRLQSRNGIAGLQVFQKEWIPMEETYFKAFAVQERCDLCFESKGR